MRVYLDACCLSRLTDDQMQYRIRGEADAIEQILVKVRQGAWTFISSEALDDEVKRNPSMERRLAVETLLSLASETIKLDSVVTRRARELQAMGYGLFDALHLASAESGDVDILLSTDDRFVKRVDKGIGFPRVQAANPVSWIQEQRL